MDRNCFLNNSDLVESLNTTRPVKSIMNKVDRKFFCFHEKGCYCDKPAHILVKQTISAPHMHAKALEYLYPKLNPGSVVLDVGSGSGYLTACFGHLVTVYSPNAKYRGKVIGLEIQKSLVNYSIRKLRKHMNILFKFPSRFNIIHGSGWDGYPTKSKQ